MEFKVGETYITQMKHKIVYVGFNPMANHDYGYIFADESNTYIYDSKGRPNVCQEHFGKIKKK
jgi:hypothetical protein